MGIEEFPEIENFQKLPRQVIIKGGDSSFSEGVGARLQGIVINNSGQSIRAIRANVVIFNDKKIPVLNTSTDVHPQELPQGGIANFVFQVQDYPEKISDYYLYANWKFDDHGV